MKGRPSIILVTNGGRDGLTQTNGTRGIKNRGGSANVRPRSCSDYFYIRSREIKGT